MNIEDEFRNYLNSKNVKETVQKIISGGIQKYLSHQAYEWHDGECPYDRSGSTRKIEGKTIGDLCKTDLEVLQAFTGDSYATYVSECGLSWCTVAYHLCSLINDVFRGETESFIVKNWDEVCAELGCKGEYNEENYEKVIEEWDIINSIYFYEWFPQYIIHEKVGNGHEWDKEVFNDIW